MQKPKMKVVSVIKQSKEYGIILEAHFHSYNNKVVVCKIMEMDCFYEYNKIISVSRPKFIYMGKAKLDPEDTFDLKIGIRLAFDAAMEQRQVKQRAYANRIQEKILKDIPKIDFILEKSFVSKLNTKIKKGRI